ncbi:hypothetical protein ABPG74_005652 [Tetrahymena malaccensis]
MSNKIILEEIDENRFCEKCKVGERQDLNIHLHLVDFYQHPFYLCEPCLKIQLKNELQDIDIIGQEITETQKKLEQVDENTLSIKNKIEENEKLINQSQQQKQKLEIEELKKKEELLNQDFEKLKKNVLDFEIRESKYWVDVNVFEKRLQTLLNKKQIADNLEQYYNDKLNNKLNKYNTINSVFFIEVSEQVGLINNLMIGKKLNEDINWDETNAGLGQVILLFLYLMNKFGYQSSQIKDIQVCGNESYICEVNKSEQLYLRGPFNNKSEEAKFNRAMKLILDEFALFVDYLQQQLFQNIQLPFKIEQQNSSIDGLILTTQTAANAQYKGLDNWTQAFKKLLINFKFLISFNAQYDSKKEIELLDRE